MSSKTYEMPDGRKAVFEYDDNGVGRITIECMDMLMGMIADRPKVEWIPCSERLPEENITVLVSIKDEWEKQRRIEFGRISSEHWEWLNESGVDYWAPAWDNSIDAWMPLPEPWGGADNDNQ